jgi:hypothetical protein
MGYDVALSACSSMCGMLVGVIALFGGAFGAKKAKVYLDANHRRYNRKNRPPNEQVEIERGSGGTRLTYS